MTKMGKGNSCYSLKCAYLYKGWGWYIPDSFYQRREKKLRKAGTLNVGRWCVGFRKPRRLRRLSLGIKNLAEIWKSSLTERMYIELSELLRLLRKKWCCLYANVLHNFQILRNVYVLPFLKLFHFFSTFTISESC